MYFVACLESRYIQQCSTKAVPVQTNYSPDGRSLLYASPNHHLFFLGLGKEGEETKESWRHSDKDAVCVPSHCFLTALTVVIFVQS